MEMTLHLIVCILCPRLWKTFTVSVVSENLIHLDLAEDNIEQFPPPVGDPSGLHIHVAAPQRLGAVEVEPRVEERRVLPGDDAALLLGGQPRVVQLLLVRDVHTQAIQVVNVVRVGSDFICKSYRNV